MPESETNTDFLASHADRWLRILGVAGGLSLVAVVAVVWYYFTPKYTRVGYQPTQPVPFSHEFHVGQLGMSCN